MMVQRKAHALSGARKAAVVVASLPRDAASQLLGRLGADAAQTIGLELARLTDLPEGAAENVLDEFVQSARVGDMLLHRGAVSAKELVRSALSPEDADDVVSRIDKAIEDKPFKFLADASAEVILGQLRNEQPQTVALVLAHMPATKAAHVLDGFPARQQGEIVRRIVHLGDASSEALKRVQDALSAKLGRPEAFVQARTGGFEQAADILRHALRGTERGALDALDTDEPQLADEIRKRLFAFEDMLRADDRGIRALLKEVSTQELSIALKTASDELRDKFFNNLSSRARDLLSEELEFMRPIRLSEVEAAQARILDAARRLEESGELFVAGRASGDDYVV